MENKNPQIKIGRDIFTITNKDWILDNGSCVQLASQTIRKGFDEYHPVLSKKLFKDLKIVGLLYQDEETKKLEKRYTKCLVYRFDIERMIEFGY